MNVCFLIFGAFYRHAVPWVLRVIGYNGMFLQDFTLACRNRAYIFYSCGIDLGFLLEALSIKEWIALTSLPHAN